MKILGVSHPYSWNNAACLIVDGKLVAFAEEERFNRMKYAPNLAPTKAIEFCLKEGGTTLRDVDHIAIGFDPLHQVITGNLTSGQSLLFAYKKIKRSIWGVLKGNTMLPFSVHDPRVHWVNHHQAHIASAFFLSGFPESNVLSYDGAGGGEAGKLGFGSGNKVDVFYRIPNEKSWGRLYEFITGKLGFQRHADEGKVMGLSSYGSSQGDYSFIDFSKSIPEINPKAMYRYLDSLKTRGKNDPITQNHKDLAATLQANLEKAGMQMVKYLVEKTGNRNLCLSGGVALNCALNGKLISSGLVDHIFVQPVSSDAGTALGAAVQVYVDLTGKRPDVDFDHLYWGPQFSNDSIEALLKEVGVFYRKENDITSTAAKLIADDKVIGFFQGRMEAGPRALGGRSILANPSNPAMKDQVNNQVKKREPWRPFAPSIQEEYVAEYAEGYYKSPFMILAFKAKQDKKKDIISAIHVDDTIRVQAVSKKTNPKYWQLIEEFRKITGVPAVLNTSFNKAGEPIVCTPEDALRTFFATGLDYLILEDFLVSKKPLA